MALPRILRQRWVPLAGGGVAIVLVAGLAIVSPGYEAQEVPRLETSVWVTRESGQYARLNTDLAELDTVRSVVDPSSLAQAGSTGVVFGQGNRQFWPIDPAVPADLIVDSSGGSSRYPDQRAQNAPPGTSHIVASGNWLLSLTDTGAVYLAPVQPAANTSMTFEVLDPFASVEVKEGEKRPVYVADAAAVSEKGDVALYSAAEAAVRLYDPLTKSFSGPTKVANAPAAGGTLSMAFVGDRWVMSSPADDSYWIQGVGSVVKPNLGAGAVLQESGPAANRVVVATSTGLTALDLGSGQPTQIVSESGTPAAPVVVDGVLVAAWLTQDGGSLWTSDTAKTVTLDTEADVLDKVQTLQPVLRTNGDRAVLNEVSSGLLWLVPSGRLIPVEQWTVDDTEQEAEGEVTVDDAAEQLPPTAVPDAFGVRAGALVDLPLLYNDHDPNRSDVLSIDPASVAGGLAEFGDLALVAGNQSASVHVRAPPGGNATFSYSVTDGLASSPPAAVSLTVVPEDQNSPPMWCGVIDCTQVWPTPQIAAGGTITVPVLNGWVDPESDPIVLADVSPADPSAPISVVPTADGEVAIRHTDANAAAELLTVRVTVMDSRGATAERDLDVAVSAAPQLDVRPGAFVALAGTSTVIDVTKLVTGGSGSYRLLDAADSSTRAGVLSVSPNVADGTIALQADSAGEFSVGFTVQDVQTLSERSATLRLSVLEQALPLGVPPLTVFVRSGEDATVDVLDAVQNTSGRVLIVATATSDTPQLTAAVVSQTHIRVRGSTPDGLPGPIGTVRYSVTDGAGNFVEGSITVFLVAPARDIAPIAVADSVTVKAGTLVDIPVLDNDVSPRGERLALYPDLVSSEKDSGGLAFVSGSQIRYLAPTEPGVYKLTYSAYLEASPERLAAATVTITVLAAGANRAPLPSTLVARVLAGKSVVIPVDSYGVDPDGDPITVVQLDQPSRGQGIATISAGGDSIEYHAPEGGVPEGQVTLSYTVRDPDGETGTGQVRIGVLGDDLADVTPVTISDRLRVGVGSTSPLTVLPLVNDRDPSQGSLTIVDLVPNAPAGSPEFSRLKSLIDSGTSLPDGTVMLRAGDVVGTQSYVYTVESSITTSTAEGLIVVTVAEGASPDRPVVTDTVVDLTTRRQVASGIDVVTGKVAWITGDPSTLKLSLWQDSTRYSVSGDKISGNAPAKGDLVPFRLDGVGADGAAVTSYGFLRIPAFDDMRVELSTAFDPVQVDEGASKEFDVSTGVLVDKRDAVELSTEAPFTVQRANSSCSPTAGTKAQYAAGENAPWSDTCAVLVRVQGQTTWSVVAVPIAVLPGQPQAILSSITRTITPGATENVDLYDNLTTWEGGRVGDTSQLDYQSQYSGTSFVVNRSGKSLTIEARADAVPGTTESIRISVSAFGGLSSTITAVVGIAAPDAPRGATFGQQCSVSGPSCTVTAVGVPGEYDPFLGKPGGGLKVVDVTADSGCSVASFAVAGTTQLTASWPSTAKPPGGTCTAVFTVQDAQGRKGTGEFQLDLQGYPATPATVSTIAFTRTSVTLEVPLGDAATAHPPVTSVAIYEGSGRVSADCSAAGPTAYRCEIDGLENGAPHTYTARAVNSIGESGDTSALTTWAYAPPEITGLTAQAVYRASVTSTTTGVVELKITAGDDAASYRVTNTGQTITRTGATTTTDVQLPAGSAVSIEIIPISRFDPPTAGANEGASRSVGVTVAGSPSWDGPGSVVVNGPNAAYSPPGFSFNGSAETGDIKYFATQTSVTCTADPAGGLDVAQGANTTTSADPNDFTGLEPNRTYTFYACASNGFGVAQTTGVQGFTWVPPPAPAGDLTYTVDSVPIVELGTNGRVQTYAVAAGPTITNTPAEFVLLYWIDGVGSGIDSFSVSFAQTPNARAAFCLANNHAQCGPESSITRRTQVDTPFRVTFHPDGLCPRVTDTTTSAANGVSISGAAYPYRNLTVSYDSVNHIWNYSLSYSGPYSDAQPINYSCTASPAT